MHKLRRFIYIFISLVLGIASADRSSASEPITQMHFGAFSARLSPFSSPQNGSDEGGGVVLKWRHLTSSGDAIYAFETLMSTFDVSSVCDLGGGKLAVSGKAPDSGNSILQVWSIRRPQVIQEFPSGNSVIIPRGIERLGLIHNLAESVRGMPTWIQSFSTSTRFIVAYTNDEIWEYSTGGDPPRIIVTTSGAQGTFDVSFNVVVRPDISVTHTELGQYMLILPTSAQFNSVLFQDQDLDGKVDLVDELSFLQFSSLDLFNPLKVNQ
jgi:hypothetical protein